MVTGLLTATNSMTTKNAFMIHVNHVQSKATIQEGDVRAALDTLATTATLSRSVLENLHVELDFVQYKNNFRESACYVPLCDAARKREEPDIGKD